MKDKPVYKDYAKQILGVILNIKPVHSADRNYSFADRWVLLLGQLLIAVSMLFIYNYSPFSNYFDDKLPVIITVIIGALLSAVYWLLFVYRFARYRVEWADREAHPEESASKNQDKYGFFLKTKETRMATLKSGVAFTAFMATVAALAFLCCYIMYSLAPTRLYYGHKQELDRLAEIISDYNMIIIEPDYLVLRATLVSGLKFEGGTGYEPPEDLVAEIQCIVKRLECGYILYINKEYEAECFTVMLSAKWGPNCDLLWFPKEVSQAEVENYMSWTKMISVTQLDEHWWQVWYNH